MPLLPTTTYIIILAVEWSNLPLVLKRGRVFLTVYAAMRNIAISGVG